MSSQQHRAGEVSHFESVNEKNVQWNKLNLIITAIYISEQVCIGWHRTGAYYTAKLTFFYDFSVKVSGAYYTSVCIIFEFLRYVSSSNLTPLPI